MFLFKSNSSKKLLGEIVNKIFATKYVHFISIITTIISYINSFSNPLLYIFLSKKFPMIQNLRKQFYSFLIHLKLDSFF